MTDRRDLELILASNVPIVVIETHDEARLLKVLVTLAVQQGTQDYRPLFRWSITDGLQRMDLDLEAQPHNAEPTNVLKHIRAVGGAGIYALLDFHPYLNDPVHVRLLKDIAIAAADKRLTLFLISHQLELPAELQRYSARLDLALPDDTARAEIVQRIVAAYQRDHPTANVEVDAKALRLLIDNLAGLTAADTERLARNAVYQDGAISATDLPQVMQAKYELLNENGVLFYEYDTTRFADIAGFRNLKVWLKQRQTTFRAKNSSLDPPRGILLIGVQGCGKSLAAKAASGIFNVPLLRLDFASLYNKYHGETERNLRESLKTAEVMAPCVLWIDELEKGIASGQEDSGTSKRVLGSFLTWMAERERNVLVVATANDISALPPELVRKGRFDEIFFVDLPSPSTRRDILQIHLKKRQLDPGRFDLVELATATHGFSGAEIEQGVVSALYAAQALRQPPATAHVSAEFAKTKPLSVVMSERINGLRAWAQDRTVPVD
jgi:SpoVK/Ycf46/Vps4 family AAA+-type ATPase